MSPSYQMIAFLEGLGGGEMFLVFILAIMLFGGDKLPGFARGMGKAMNEFKKAKGDVERELRRAIEEAPEDKPKVTEPQPQAEEYSPMVDLPEEYGASALPSSEEIPGARETSGTVVPAAPAPDSTPTVPNPETSSPAPVPSPLPELPALPQKPNEPPTA
jgi:sec-independent protein translocase protein TatA